MAEIEIQSKSTEEKIFDLDQKLEEFLDIKEDLILQYKIEKEKRLKLNQNIDNLKERSEENSRLFVFSDKKMSIPDFKNSKQIHNEENIKIQSNTRIKR